ncbi:transposase [Bradyrhizobium sp. WSM 1738]|nr:transposase [Bradyrhizobium hereditatis]
MDSDKWVAQFERLEVVETGRRRCWSEDEKVKIVLESLRAPRQVAATTRRYGVSCSLLLRCGGYFALSGRMPPAGGVQDIGYKSDAHRHGRETAMAPVERATNS